MSVLVLEPVDRGRTVSVHVGDSLVLRLPENPGTGYRWIPSTIPALRITGDRNEQGDAPGAAGVRVLEFTAIAAGRSYLSLRCIREWNPESPADAFDVSIDVSAAGA